MHIYFTFLYMLYIFDIAYFPYCGCRLSSSSLLSRATPYAFLCWSTSNACSGAIALDNELAWLYWGKMQRRKLKAKDNRLGYTNGHGEG